jgi:centrosomal protein CEP112
MFNEMNFQSDLERMQETIQAQLENSKRIIGELESDRLRLEQEQESQLQDVKSQSQSLQDELKHQHALAAARAADHISELGQTVTELKKALKLKEQEKQKSVKSLEVEHQKDKQRLEHAYEKKIRSIQADLAQQEAENKQKLQKLSILVRERDDQLVEMRAAQRDQAQRAQQALDEFKQQAEKNSTRMFDDMKAQMERVETDLGRSKAAREKIARDATHQIEELRTKHSRELSDVKLHYEQEKAVLVQQQRTELESIVRERDRERDAALKHMQSVLAEQETKMRSKEHRDAQAC